MKESMRSKLKQIARRLEEIDAMLASPDVTNDMNRFRDLSRERAEILLSLIHISEPTRHACLSYDVLCV